MGSGDAWALLTRLLEERFGLDRLPRVARTEAGKPWFPELPRLFFNLSHSGGLILCGVGRAPLGVDIERLRPRRPGLARYVLSELEFAWFQHRGATGEACIPCGP